MNLRKTLVTIIAAVALMASVAAPIAHAQITDIATATVTLTEAGEFNVYICEDENVLSPGSAVTSSTGSVAKGHIGICYFDTASYRQGFTVALLASDFEHATLPGVVIPAANFEPLFVYNPHQGQWGWTNPNQAPGTYPHVPGSAATPGSFDVGDIGGLRGAGGYVTGNFVTSHPGATWQGVGLDTNPLIGYSWDGVGTANGALMPHPSASAIPHVDGGAVPPLTAGSITDVVNGTYAGLDVQLAIPPGAPAGTYESTLTVTLTVGEP